MGLHAGGIDLKINELTAEAPLRHFSLGAHPEIGMFVERHYINESASRAASGAIHYCVAPGKRTHFHRIQWIWLREPIP